MRFVPATTILGTVKNPPDCFFGGHYNINLYRGCPHACIYCDTRSDCYGIGNLSDIRAKENALAILDKELGSKRRKGTVTTGSMNDPYMPLEKKLKLTRGALHLVALHKFGVHVLTKSDLAARDADILAEVGTVYAAVSFTVTTADNELARRIEPGAPAPDKRFHALARLAEAGIYVGVNLMPVLPFLTDSPDNIRTVLRRAAESGAQYVNFVPGMTLRDTCRSHYYTQLDRHFPGLRKRYAARYGQRYNCQVPEAARLGEFYRAECARLGLATRMKFYARPEQKQLSLFGK